jgi:hypothetical protein
MALSAGIRVWHLTHTEVPARDGIGFIRYAWQLRHEGWAGVLRANPHPPLYPLAIAALSLPVGAVLGTPDSERAMLIAAQLANALAGVLLVVPMFFLGKRLFDRRVAFGAALLFQCLPLEGRVLSDSLSEGLFLLLAASALALACRALEAPSVASFGLSGLFAGLAYLTRPEGLLLVAAALLVLAGLQLAAGGRRRWRPALAGGSCLVAAAVAVGAPYALVIGHLTNKPTGDAILGEGAALPRSNRPRAPEADTSASAAVVTPGAALFAVYSYDARDYRFAQRLTWAALAVGGELVRGFHYVAWIPALFATVWYWGQMRGRPAAWLLFLTCALHLALLFRLAYVAGYISERHSMLIVMCTSFWAIAGLDVLARWVAARAAARGWSAAPGLRSALGPVLLSAFLVSSLPKTLEPLHANRAGYHAAGCWLAENAQSADRIVDPFEWVQFYAGRVLHPPAESQGGTPPGCLYVVVGGSEKLHDRLPLLPAAQELAAQGTRVYHWPDGARPKKAEEVSIYRVGMPPAARSTG